MGAGDEDLRAAALAGNLQHVDLDAVVDRQLLGGHLLAGLQKALGAAQLDVNLLVLDALDDGGEYLVFLLAVFVVDHAPLGLAQMLHHHLLGGLRRDAAEVLGRHLDLHQIAQLILGLYGPGFLQRHLALGILHRLHDGLAAEHLHAALFGVDGGANVGVFAEVLFICGNQRGLDRAEEYVFIDAPLLAQGVQGAEKLIGINSAVCHGYIPPVLFAAAVAA